MKWYGGFNELTKSERHVHRLEKNIIEKGQEKRNDQAKINQERE